MFLQLSTSTFDLDQIGQFSVDNIVFGLVRILFLVGFFVYILFAFLIVRQIEVMRSTVITPLSPFIKLVGYIHLLLAIGAFIFAFTYLS